MFTWQSGNSAVYALANFPVGRKMQQLSPNSKIQLAAVFSKSNLPKTQIEWKIEGICKSCLE